MALILQTWMRWLMRIVLPFSRWRVPVMLLRGPDRASGREVNLLSAGWGYDFIRVRFFASEPAVVRTVTVPVWRLERVLRVWRAQADFTVIGIDRVSSRVFLRRRYLAVPMSVGNWMEVPKDMKAFARKRQNCAADIRRVRIHKLDVHLSRDEEDFDLFYDRYYKPHVSRRHGSLAVVGARTRIRLIFKSGILLWITRNGERLAASIEIIRGKDYYRMVNGVLDGRADLLAEGVLTATYVHSIEKARELGCTRIHMGGNEPSPHDGVFRYKNKWATGIALNDSILGGNCILLLDWNQLGGPVADFLSHTSLFHHDMGGFSALWAFPHSEPLTAENLERYYRRLKTHGVHSFHILLPGGVPVDFVCPSEVHLIPLPVVNTGGPEGLTSYLRGKRRA